MSLQKKPFPAGACKNCAAGLEKWRNDAGADMGMDRRNSFLLKANVCCEPPWWMCQSFMRMHLGVLHGVANNRWHTGGDLCCKAEQIPCYSMRAMKLLGDLCRGCCTGKACDSWRGWKSHPFPALCTNLGHVALGSTVACMGCMALWSQDPKPST